MLNRRTICFTAVAAIAGASALVACSSKGEEPFAPKTASPARPTQSNGLSHPAWANGQNFQGPVDPNETIRVQIHFRMRNEAEADARLLAISDPDNAAYGQFLSDDEFAAKYAPTSDDVAAVRAHLESNGLTVTHVPTNNLFVSAEGPASKVGAAFSTQLGNYAVGGAVKHAPMTDASLPAAISARVLGVLGLMSDGQFKPNTVHTGGISRDQLDPDATSTTGTCSEWWGSTPDATDPPLPGYGPLALAPCGYKPAQLRRAYGLDDAILGGNNGAGQSVAIVDAYFSPTLFQDAQTYAANNDPDFPLAASQWSAQWGPGTLPTKPDTGWYGEQSLDVEAVHAMAPKANIVFLGAVSANDQDLIAAINTIISGKLATVVSNSYGGLEWSPDGPNDFLIWHNVATQAGLKGIGLYFSSGDSGDESADLGFPSADFPASLDNATAVGGTSMAIGQDGSYLFETGWETGVTRLQPPQDAGADAEPTTGTGTFNDAGLPLSWTPAPPGDFVFGAGGGVSLVYAQPTWQAGIVPDAIANEPGAPARCVPDVAMLADPITGFLIGESNAKGVYKESPIGGTSLASPLFTATVALAQQHAKKTFGFANAKLYKASKKAGFRDVVPPAQPTAVAVRAGVVTTFDFAGQSIKTATGWDTVTGLGTPNGQSFLDAMK